MALGLALAVAIAGASVQARALTLSGATAATIVGAAAVTAGWSWGVMLVVFFVLTSALSAHRSAHKAEMARAMVDKGGARDAIQVLANGGAFALAGVAWLASGSAVWLAAGAGALAAAAADSWATEIGVAFGGQPRSILSLKPASRGASGAISALGTLGGAVGATSMAGTVLIIGWGTSVAAAAGVAGVLGMLVDSLLGATVQARRFCPTCSVETEQPVHNCGVSTTIIRGARWMNNDMVNALATISGAVIAALLFHVSG